MRKVVGVSRDSLGQIREKSDMDWAHQPERRGIVAQEVLKKVSLLTTGCGVEPEVKVQIVHARAQRDVEDRRQSADAHQRDAVLLRV